MSFATPAAPATSVPRTAQGAPFRVMPGFNLSLGFTILYLALIVLIPLSAIFLKTFTMTWEGFWSAITSDRVLASYRLSFGAALIGAAINVVFGGIVAWVLVRYNFPG
jgi:sulfate transport system permease protein